MKVLIAGDFVPRYRVADQIDKGVFSCLDEVLPILQETDFAIVNFESPVVMHNANPIDKTGPNLRCTEKAMKCLTYAGFGCVSLANNHFRDYGQVGVEDTLEACRKNGIAYVGGGRDLSEAQQIFYRTIEGEQLAIVNVCENEWSIASEEYGGSAPLNPVKNYFAIQEARKHADYVLVIVHGGIEGYQYPTPRMQETYRFFVEAGADAVINHHQHCYSGYELYHHKPIFYGLGNLCFDINNPNNTLWKQGYLVNLSFNKGRVDYRIIPYKQCDEAPAVVLLKGEELDIFQKTIIAINSVIETPKQLQQELLSYIQSSEQSRLLEFEPFSNVFIRKLQSKKWLPSFVSRKARKDIYDVINCESHREIILRVFHRLLS